MRACFAPTCCAVAGQERDRRATTLQCNIRRTFSSHFTLHSSHPALHASHLHFTFHRSSYLKSSDFFSPHVTSSDLFSSHPIPSHISSKQVLLNYFHVIRALKKAHLNSSQLRCTLESSYRQSLHKVYFPVLLCTTKLAQWLSQDYVVLQSLHKVLPSTTSYYKAFTTHFPVLLRTTKLAPHTSQLILRTTKRAQSTSQYYFVLQSLHKVLPSTTSYYKSCTTYFPVLLRTTKLAQKTSQYYFVLQSLNNVLPSTASYYKACTKYFSVLLRTTKLAQSTSR